MSPESFLVCTVESVPRHLAVSRASSACSFLSIAHLLLVAASVRSAAYQPGMGALVGAA